MATQTETLIVPYSRDTFYEAVHISTAGDLYEERNGQKFVHDILAPIFKKHKVEEVFGVGLVHRHFDIEEDEKLVEFNMVATPWAVDVGPHHLQGKKTDSLIYELSWMLNADGKWMAFEFSFSPGQGKRPYIVNIRESKYYDFLVEFTQALQTHNQGNLFGLRAWPGPGFGGVFEFTQGKANINLIPEEASFEEGVKYQETQWFWADEYVKKAAGCYCATNRINGHIGHAPRSGCRLT